MRTLFFSFLSYVMMKRKNVIENHIVDSWFCVQDTNVS